MISNSGSDARQLISVVGDGRVGASNRSEAVTRLVLGGSGSDKDLARAIQQLSSTSRVRLITDLTPGLLTAEWPDVIRELTAVIAYRRTNFGLLDRYADLAADEPALWLMMAAWDDVASSAHHRNFGYHALLSRRCVTYRTIARVEARIVSSVLSSETSPMFSYAAGAKLPSVMIGEQHGNGVVHAVLPLCARSTVPFGTLCDLVAPTVVDDHTRHLWRIVAEEQTATTPVAGVSVGAVRAAARELRRRPDHVVKTAGVLAEDIAAGQVGDALLDALPATRRGDSRLVELLTVAELLSP